MAPTTATPGSGWDNVPQAPPDFSIFALNEAFKKDPHPKKLSLCVGVYRTEEGEPLVLSCVKKAERALLDDPASGKEYLPAYGNSDFCRLSRELAFGPDCPAVQEGRIATFQGVSGTGSLRVGAEFLANHYPSSVVYIPNPSWGPHRPIFSNAGLQVQEYRYFQPETKGLDFEGLMSDVSTAAPGSILLLHTCAHNPSGVDPSLEQWRALLDLTVSRGLIPFFDMAYQGFASGDLDVDAAPLRMFANSPGMELLLAQSFSKNMGLYGERTGALSVLCRSVCGVPRIMAHLTQVVGAMYLNPPHNGAAIASKVMGDAELLQEWKEEVRSMAGRISAMRHALFNALQERQAPGDWSCILNQTGMFSYTGLTPEQCINMTNKWHVYMTRDGRISMAGLSASRAGYLADAMVDSLQLL